jgi:hypothetical protein
MTMAPFIDVSLSRLGGALALLDYPGGGGNSSPAEREWLNRIPHSEEKRAAELREATLNCIARQVLDAARSRPPEVERRIES